MWETVVASAISGVFSFVCGVWATERRGTQVLADKRSSAMEKYFFEAGLCLNVHKLLTPFKIATASLIPYLGKRQTKTAERILKLMQDGDFRTVEEELIKLSIQLQKFHKRI